ncbi:hypothetical protein [Sulfobacillus harzensis]|uniref:Uncharacterized protein n=1 Tax=Sulfobacillus harzensis TaxID=2729629 RepID=A0A7Y0L6D4_9FIRM|nr:hypothetical protein [Sulfobacillus harzensis]NMP24055.1 hypothetical protein [Sulfobacillus harzensis]
MRQQYLAPAIVIVGLGAYVAFSVSRPQPAPHRAASPQAAANRTASVRSRLIPPPATAPLLTREAWIMQWQPSWIQRAWRKSGKPPLLWGQTIGPGGMWGYYFTQNPSIGESSNITLPKYPPPRVMQTDAPSWYGWPLKP